MDRRWRGMPGGIAARFDAVLVSAALMPRVHDVWVAANAPQGDHLPFGIDIDLSLDGGGEKGGAAGGDGEPAALPPAAPVTVSEAGTAVLPEAAAPRLTGAVALEVPPDTSRPVPVPEPGDTVLTVARDT